MSMTATTNTRRPSLPLLQLLLVLAAVASDRATNAEVFSAIVHVESAFRAERDLAADVRSYVQREQSRLSELARLADELEKHSAGGGSHHELEQHLSNPVSAYSTIRDLYQGAKRVEQLVTEATRRSKDFYNVSVITSDLMPTQIDLTSAAVALFRLQDTYEIPTFKVIDGQFLEEGMPPTPQLSVADVIEIGKAAYGKGDYYHAALWLAEALDRLTAGVSDEARFEVLDYLAFSLFKQGNLKRALVLTEQALLLRPDDARMIANRDYYIRDLGEEAARASAAVLPPLVLNRPLDSYQTTDSFAAYEALCRGESVMRVVDQDRLVCRYTTGGRHPLLLFSPARMEELNRDPYIVFYHQFLSDAETELIKNLSVPKLHRSGVFTPSGDGAKDYRTSKSAWLEDSVHPTIERISRRIAAVTGLSAATSEPLQVLNYGIGGHYEPHEDFVRDSNIHHRFSSGHGNRLATFINYLSDVHAGGWTAFPKLGISVRPEKGGAAFWYNLHRDGTGDERTLHAACPVLSGIKWVANKWFHESANEFARPCLLQPDSQASEAN